MGGKATLGIFEDNTARISSYPLISSTQIFIKEYESEGKKVKRKGTIKQKLAYLIARMKNKPYSSNNSNPK